LGAVSNISFADSGPLHYKNSIDICLLIKHDECLKLSESSLSVARAETWIFPYLSKVSTFNFHHYCFTYFSPLSLMKSMSILTLGDSLPFVISVIGLLTSGVLGDLTISETTAKGPRPIAPGFDDIICRSSTEVPPRQYFLLEAGYQGLF